MKFGKNKSIIKTQAMDALSVEEIIEYYDSEIKGLKSSSGLVVGDISKHAAMRILERGITKQELLDVVLSAPMIYPGNEPDTICQQIKDLRIVFSSKTGKVISLVRLEEDV